MISIDGSHGEGGGSLLRQALALSIITQKPFRISNIRKGRSKPGLQPQHVSSIELAKQVCDAKVTGSFVGSMEVEFYPNPIKKGKDIDLDVGTAGSLTLLLQSVFLPALLSNEQFKFTLKGGTDVKWSPSIDYFENIFLPVFRDAADIKFQLVKRGYYPKGKGEIKLSVKGNGKKISKLDLDRKLKLLSYKVILHSGKELAEDKILERMAETVKAHLKGAKAEIMMTYVSSDSVGAGIFVQAAMADDHDSFVRLGSDILLDKESDAENAAKQAAEEISKEIKAGSNVDKHLADQLIPLLAVVGGTIKTSEITDHTRSNIYLAELFTGAKIKVDNNVIKKS